MKFVDNTTLIGLISDGDESGYRREIDDLVTCFRNIILELNAVKTVKMIVDFMRNPALPVPIVLSNSPVNTVKAFRLLGTIISQDLKLELNIISFIKKAQQSIYFL